VTLGNCFNLAVTLNRCANFYRLAASAMLMLCVLPAGAWHSTLYPADWQPPTNGAVLL